MRRALSLFALAGSLFMAAGQLTLDTIKAVDTDVADKDSWSVKGQISDLITFDTLEGIVLAGISTRLVSADGTVLDTVNFTEDDCKFYKNERGVSCKINSASLSVKLFTRTTRTRVPAVAASNSGNKNKTSNGDNKNKTSHGDNGGKDDFVRVTETFWRVRGAARRRELDGELNDDGLTVDVLSGGVSVLDTLNDDCTEKTLAHGQTRVTCVPIEP